MKKVNYVQQINLISVVVYERGHEERSDRHLFHLELQYSAHLLHNVSPECLILLEQIETDRHVLLCNLNISFLISKRLMKNMLNTPEVQTLSILEV